MRLFLRTVVMFVTLGFAIGAMLVAIAILPLTLWLLVNGKVWWFPW